MDLETKQFELIKRHYGLIEGYKSLRIKIPVFTSGTMLTIASLNIENASIIGTKNVEYIFTLILIIISAFSTTYYFFNQKNYNHCAECLYYLYDKLQMDCKDFYNEGKSYRYFKYQKGQLMFTMGYVLMLATLISSILLLTV